MNGKERKPLRKLVLKVNPQTAYHLEQWAAMAGWGSKDLGRVVDKIVRERCVEGK